MRQIIYECDVFLNLEHCSWDICIEKLCEALRDRQTGRNADRHFTKLLKSFLGNFKTCKSMKTEIKKYHDSEIFFFEYKLN